MKELNYVALDLETTGLNPKTDRILEIGAVKVAAGTVVDEMSVFVNSKMQIPDFITRLTGINEEMVKDGLETHEAISRLVDFCQDFDILGHNIMFDFSFVKRNAVNCGYVFEKRGIDTLKIAKKHLANLPSRKLEALCTYYGIEQGRCHRALDDALAASNLYQRLAEEFFAVDEAAFNARPLYWEVKKEGPITKSQKVYLIDLIKYHRIDVNVQVETLTKNEASRMIDKIILNYGRIKR